MGLELVSQVKRTSPTFSLLSENERLECFLFFPEASVKILVGSHGLCGDAERRLRSLVWIQTSWFKTPLNWREITIGSRMSNNLCSQISFSYIMFCFLPVPDSKRAPVMFLCSENTAVTKMHLSYRGPSVWKEHVTPWSLQVWIFSSLTKCYWKAWNSNTTSTPCSCSISHVLILLTLVLPIFQLYDMP